MRRSTNKVTELCIASFPPFEGLRHVAANFVVNTAGPILDNAEMVPIRVLSKSGGRLPSTLIEYRVIISCMAIWICFYVDCYIVRPQKQGDLVFIPDCGIILTGSKCIWHVNHLLTGSC